MGIRQFETVMFTWNILFFAVLILGTVNAIVSVRRQNKKFILSYVLELLTVPVNMGFMYIIDSGYVDYGNDKFSGLSAMGDWFGFGILILITMILLLITVICNIWYVIKKKKESI